MPTLKETPSEATLPSHRLMLRAGLIHQTTSGIYTWLPLGVRVLRNIERIIKEEQDAAGFHQITMPTIQPADLWKESGRYDDYGKEMLRIKDRHERDMLYGPTAEEVVTDVARNYVHSYKQLPLVLYQMTTKFRDEIRPRFGVMRGREFLMKDGYSFDLTPEDAKKTYEKVYNSYIKIFDRIFKNVGDPENPKYDLKVIPVKAETGPIGGDLSHEFQVIAPHGESKIFFDNNYFRVKKRDYESLKDIYASSEELHDPSKCKNKEIREETGIELGHIFYFGDKYSKAMDFKIAGKDGKPMHPYGGSYGIGISRVAAAVIEASHDEKGIVWPVSVAPFGMGLVSPLKDKSHVEGVYEMLLEQGISVLYDDREGQSLGVKFAEMDLIGLPYLVVIGKRFETHKEVEIKYRRGHHTFHTSYENFCMLLKDMFVS